MKLRKKSSTESDPRDTEDTHSAFSPSIDDPGSSAAKIADRFAEDTADVNASDLRCAQVQQLYYHASTTIYFTMTAIVVFVLSFWSVASHSLLIVWAVCITAVYLLRHAMIVRFLRSDIQVTEAAKWEYRFIGFVLMTGILWGAASVLFFPTSYPLHQGLLVIILGGLCNGALVVYCTLKSVYLTFVLVGASPLVAMFFYQGTRLHLIMGVMVAVYIVVLIVTGNQINATLRRYLRLRFVKNNLIDSLTQENQRVDDLYEALKEEMGQKEKAVAALAESEHKYRELVEKAHDIIFNTDASGHFTYVNPVGSRLSGYSEDELIGKHFAELIHPEFRETAEKFYGRQFVKKIPDTYLEFPFVTKEGGILWVGQLVHLLEDEATVTGFQAIARDITDRRRAEAALKDSEERFREFADLLPQFVFETDRDARLTFLNRAGLAELGYELADLARGVTLFDVLDPGDRERAVAQRDMILNGARLQGEEYTLVNAQGNTVPVVTYSSNILQDGQVAGMRGVAVDISEIKASQAALRKAQVELEDKVEERTADLLRVKEELEALNRLGREVTASRSTKRTLQSAVEEIWSALEADVVMLFVHDDEGLKLKAIMPTSHEFANGLPLHKVGECLCGLAVRDGNPIFSTSICTDPKCTWQECRDAGLQSLAAIPLRAASETLGVLAIGSYVERDFSNRAQFLEALGNEIAIGLKNALLFEQEEAHARELEERIADLRRSEEERERLHSNLLQAQKMEAVGTLAAGIAHDFNNLLQAIMASAEMILFDEREGGQDQSAVMEIKHAAKTGAELTRSLLMFSRRVESSLMPVDLNRELRIVAKLLKRTFTQMIEIEMKLSQNLYMVKGDPAQLQQVLMNLAVNARDAMPDGGKLVIETRNVYLDEEYCRYHVDTAPGNYVLLSVSDSGVGMDAKTRQQIFDPFFTTKRAQQGTGLGLSIVFGIVRSHGGSIMCYSEPGHGTTFKIYFPAVETGYEEDLVETAGSFERGTETILLVDDDDPTRKVGAALLRRFGYEVLTGCNGKDGLEVFSRAREHIGLVILDLMMPEMSGTECLREILKLAPGAKVVIASGYAANGRIDKALEEGARTCLHKPYEARQLLEVVRKLLDEERV